MELEIQIQNSGRTVSKACEENFVSLCYKNAYVPGDRIVMRSSQRGYYWVCLEDSLSPVLAYFTGKSFEFEIPFDEKRASYSPKCFTGNKHLLWVRAATDEDIGTRRNLAFNPLDHHQNNTLFPHAYANVETRGEAWFAARNAIDGNVESGGHGAYPYGSWGINRQADAELTIFFGRPVRIDQLVITLRADFPHDNWWKTAEITFSDGSTEILQFSKSSRPQSFSITPRIVDSLKMHDMHPDETDPSPFPALTQLEAWGADAIGQ